MHPSTSATSEFQPYGAICGFGNCGIPFTLPSSRDGALVFTVNAQKGQVEYWMYSPAMTQGAISIEEVADFLQGVDVLIKPIFKSNLPMLANLCMCLCFLGLIGMMVILCSFTSEGRYTREKIDDILLFLGIEIVGFFFITFWLSLSFLASRLRKRMQEAKERIQPYIQLHNSNFQARGYFWVAPVHFPYWIELWRESPAQGMPVRPEMLNIQSQRQEQGHQMSSQQMPNYGGGIELNSRTQKRYMELKNDVI